MDVVVCPKARRLTIVAVAVVVAHVLLRHVHLLRMYYWAFDCWKSWRLTTLMRLTFAAQFPRPIFVVVPFATSKRFSDSSVVNQTETPWQYFLSIHKRHTSKAREGFLGSVCRYPGESLLHHRGLLRSSFCLFEKAQFCFVARFRIQYYTHWCR